MSSQGAGELPVRGANRVLRRQWSPDARALSVVGDRWLMVIVRDLAAGPLRLEALRRWLPGLSAGALEARLVRMAEEGLLIRRRHRAVPPRVDLELTDRGHALAEIIAGLARWELQTQWSRPRDDEWVDVGACFRLAPFLDPRDGRLPDGDLALTITGTAGADTDHYTFTREAGRSTVVHRRAPEPQAGIAATQDGWVQALSPEGTRTSLRATGEEALVASFLGLFSVPRR